MLPRLILADTLSVTFSLALAFGLLRFVARDGQMIVLYGRDHVHVSRLVRQVAVEE